MSTYLEGYISYRYSWVHGLRRSDGDGGTLLGEPSTKRVKVDIENGEVSRCDGHGHHATPARHSQIPLPSSLELPHIQSVPRPCTQIAWPKRIHQGCDGGSQRHSEPLGGVSALKSRGQALDGRCGGQHGQGARHLAAPVADGPGGCVFQRPEWRRLRDSQSWS